MPRPYEKKVRKRDGATTGCPDHPDGPLEQGYTLSGQLKTWCAVDGCTRLAEWLPSEGVGDEQ